MGKVDDYTAGRSQGLILAREIVKKDGIEGLEKEIQFRKHYRNQHSINQKRTKHCL